MKCDKIAVVVTGEGGREGPPKELLKAEGIYRMLSDLYAIS